MIITTVIIAVVLYIVQFFTMRKIYANKLKEQERVARISSFNWEDSCMRKDSVIKAVSNRMTRLIKNLVDCQEEKDQTVFFMRYDRACQEARKYLGKDIT